MLRHPEALESPTCIHHDHVDQSMGCCVDDELHSTSAEIWPFTALQIHLINVQIVQT